MENAAQIAAVPGVDALFLGPDDIMLRRGYSMTTPRSAETLGEDMKTVTAACQSHDKLAVMIAGSPEMMKLCLQLGAQLIVTGGDAPFLVSASKKAATEAWEALESFAAQNVPPRGDDDANPSCPSSFPRSAY